MSFQTLDEVPVADPDRAGVYEHGWQSWSPTGCYRATAQPPRPVHDWQQVIRFRPETPCADGAFQGEGLLVIDPGDGSPVRAYAAARPDVSVPSIRARLSGRTIAVSADGPDVVASTHASVNDALTSAGAGLGAQLGASLRPAPTVWCTWYQYFLTVTQADVMENLREIERHELPVDVVQVDDGWQADIGDWLNLSPRFSSLADLASAIHASGRRAGIWLAPFLVGSDSAVAHAHPDWVVADGGTNWNQRLLGLDLTFPPVRDYLTDVFTRLRALGFDYFKLDFVYAGALPGRRHADVTGVEAYRSGLALVREAVGPDSYVVACGAPQLPSIGLVDAMRVSPDTYNPDDPDSGTNVLRGVPNVRARAWQHGRLWVNDADCLVARPEFARRAEWAAAIEEFGGLRSASDRISTLDAQGLEMTRRLLSTAPPPVPFASLPPLA